MKQTEIKQPRHITISYTPIERLRLLPYPGRMLQRGPNTMTQAGSRGTPSMKKSGRCLPPGATAASFSPALLDPDAEFATLASRPRLCPVGDPVPFLESSLPAASSSSSEIPRLVPQSVLCLPPTGDPSSFADPVPRHSASLFGTSIRPFLLPALLPALLPSLLPEALPGVLPGTGLLPRLPSGVSVLIVGSTPVFMSNLATTAPPASIWSTSDASLDQEMDLVPGCTR